MNSGLKVLMITCEWPSEQYPHSGIFVHRQVQFLQREGVGVKVFSFRGSKNPFRYLNAWLQVRKILREESFDIAHAQWSQSAFPILIGKLPLVVTFRGSDVMGTLSAKGRPTLSGWILRIYTRIISIVANQVVLVSPDLSLRLPPREFSIIPSGIDLTVFKPIDRTAARRQLGLPKDGKVVLFGGSPANPEKRYLLALSAIHLLREELTDVEIIGVDRIPHERMPFYMNACNVLLLTSSHEGSPNVVKEALACNIPVVSTDVGDVGIRLAKIDGCIVCKEDNPETIAQALFQVLRRNSRVAGRESVVDLDEAILTKRLIEVYRLALTNAS